MDMRTYALVMSLELVFSLSLTFLVDAGSIGQVIYLSSDFASAMDVIDAMASLSLSLSLSSSC